MATYAIGDVQGCFDELKNLLTHIKFSSDCDQLWFCGDIVNRGPKSLETLRFIKSLEANAVTVLGNHDLHLLATAYAYKKPGKKDTLDAILQAPDSAVLLDWLRHQHMIYHDDKTDITMLHAGIHPSWSIQTALLLAGEVESMLRSNQHTNFFKHMYGDKPFIWDESLSGWARFRFITNMFTRLRYCDIDGKPALGAKGAPGTQSEHLYPWYEVPSRESKDDTIVFGHWSTLPQAGNASSNNTYAIDSGCLWGGKLTALRIDVQPFQYFQFQCPGAQKPPSKYLKELKKQRKNIKVEQKKSF